MALPTSSHHWREWLLAIVALLLLGWSQAAAAQDEPQAAQETPASYQQVWQLKISGVIGPASSDLLIRTIDDAASAPVHLLLVTLDTPGGLDTSMRAMIHKILASTVPVVMYVHPKGARAASAGTYLLYASHVAAMSPATNLGAATPVQIGMPNQPTRPGEKEQQQPTAQSAMQKKIINDAVAYIRGLAALHGRNADWAEQAVREGVSLDSGQAVEQSVVDLVALDVNDLLQQLEGRVIQVRDQDYQLNPTGLEIVVLELDWRYEFLSTITNPNVAYILMLIGIYGLLLEFYNPGVGLPGIIGAISLLTALYALQLLPISYAGLALIVLGLALMIMEALSPSFGIFGMGGVAAFVLGSIMLMDTELPEFQIALPLIAAFAMASVVICIFALYMALKSRKSPVVSGLGVLVGQSALTLCPVHENGKVRLNGEIWNARSPQPIAANTEVVVRAVEGLTLDVTRAEGDP